MRQLQGKFDNKEILLICNGPSLNKQLDLISEYKYTFAVNVIFRLQREYDFTPSFYCVEDDLVFKNYRNEIMQLSAGYKFIPDSLLKNIDIVGKNITPITCDYGFYHHGFKFGVPRFSHDASKVVYAGGSVTYLCLQIIKYLGFSSIKIIGLDHAYNLDKVSLLNSHTLLTEGNDDNHFDPTYFGYGKLWHDPKLDFATNSYSKAQRVFKQRQIEIINLTPNSRLKYFSDLKDNLISVQKPTKPQVDINNVFVSIIIPIYNVENFLHECLVSVENQMFAGDIIEVILIDDCSSDSSANITSEFTSRNSNWRLIQHQKNLGLSEARNTGIQFAVGKYVAFLDSDDWISSDMVARNLAYTHTNGEADIIVNGIVKVNANGTKKLLRKFPHKLDKERYLTALSKSQFPNVAWGQLISRKYLKKINFKFKPHVLHEDIYTSVQLIDQAKTIGFLNGKLFFWRIRSSSISQSINATIIHDYLNGFKKRTEYIKQKPNNRLNVRTVFTALRPAISGLQTRIETTDDLTKRYEYQLLLVNLFRTNFSIFAIMWMRPKFIKIYIKTRLNIFYRLIRST